MRGSGGVNVGCRLGMDRNLLLYMLAGQYCQKSSNGGSQRVEDAVNGKIYTFRCYFSYDDKNIKNKHWIEIYYFYIC